MARAFWFLLLVSVASAVELGTTAYTQRVTTGRLAQYTFSQTNQSIPILPDNNVSPLGPLVNQSIGAVWNQNSIGLAFPAGRGNRMLSVNNVTTMIPMLQNGDFTVDMWVSSYSPGVGDSSAYIWSFDTISTTVDETQFASGFTDAPPLSFAVVGGSNFANPVVAITDGGGGGSTRVCANCNALWPMHITATYQSSYLGVGFSSPSTHLQLFINNVQLVTYDFENGDEPSPMIWTNTNQLHLARHTINIPFGTAGVDYNWEGTFYSTAIYSRVLTNTEIATNFNAFLPNSLPYIPGLPNTGVISVTALELLPSIIHLYGSDYDLVLNSTWPSSERPTSFNPPALSYLLFSLPSNGALFYRTAPSAPLVPINASDLPFSLPPNFNNTYDHATVFYVSAGYAFGTAYDSFVYGVSDQVAPQAANATISIDVSFVNHPPLAYSTVVLVQSAVATLVTFTGIDNDNPGMALDGPVYLASLPTHGFLSQTSTPTVPITQTYTVVTDSNRMVYYTSNELAAQSETDYIVFQLQDALGLYSLPAAVTLDVINNLQPPSVTVSMCMECALSQCACLIDLVIPDNDGLNDTIFTVTSIPSFGQLFVGSNVPIFQTGLPFSFNPAHLALTYVYDGFTNGNDSFTYQVTRGSYTSEDVTNELYVAPSYNPPTINGPAKAAVPLFKSILLNLTVFDVDEATAPTPGIYTMLVRSTDVTVRITLNPASMPFITFTLGDGFMDPDMTYSGPYDAIVASVHPVNLTSFGEGGQNSSFTVEDVEQSQATLTLILTVTGTIGSTPLSGSSGLSTTDVMWIYIGAAAFLVIVCVLCCCFCDCCLCCLCCAKTIVKKADTAVHAAVTDSIGPMQDIQSYMHEGVALIQK